MSRWEKLTTEARNERSRDLDTRDTTEVVDLLLEEDQRAIEGARRHRDAIALAAAWVAETLEGGSDVVFAGAGTSGRLGVLEASECPPTFGTDPGRIRAWIAGGDEAVFRAREGAEDRRQDGEAAADELDEGDLLIGLSASSVTAYVHGALAGARERGVRTVLVTCTSQENLRQIGLADVADLVLALDTGPEVLTGSTRLKAGSATKAVLNAITTAAMVRLGKVYDNLMVDLRPGSAKLEDRALRITRSAGEVSLEDAKRLLEAADGEVKTAIVMARLGIDVDDARRRLDAAGGHVRRALEAL